MPSLNTVASILRQAISLLLSISPLLALLALCETFGLLQAQDANAQYHRLNLAPGYDLRN